MMRFVTLGVAIVVAIIAGVQYLVNRSKLRLDLYNRRFEIYNKTVDFFAVVLYFDPPKASEDDHIKYESRERDFVRSHRESLFLFNSKSEVFQLLDEFRKKAYSMVNYRTIKEQTRNEDQTQEHLVKAREEYLSELKWVKDDFKPQLEKAVAKYLNFHRVAGVW